MYKISILSYYKRNRGQKRMSTNFTNCYEMLLMMIGGIPARGC